MINPFKILLFLFYRYQIFIQVRNDLISGRMQVDENLFVTLCGLILQCW